MPQTAYRDDLAVPPQPRARIARPTSAELRRRDNAREIDDMVTSAMNVAIALAMLLFLAPLMIVIAVLIFVRDGGPVLVADRRVGHGGRRFRRLRFRSTALDADDRLADVLMGSPQAWDAWLKGRPPNPDPRLTRLGAFLRRSGLDELPQLFNVVSGEMSLVGPRPITDGEIAAYGRRYGRYCAVKPGVTGLWQISRRGRPDDRTRVAMDCLYSARRNAWLDFRVLLWTVPVILARRDPD